MITSNAQISDVPVNPILPVSTLETTALVKPDAKTTRSWFGYFRLGFFSGLALIGLIITVWIAWILISTFFIYPSLISNQTPTTGITTAPGYYLSIITSPQDDRDYEFEKYGRATIHFTADIEWVGSSNDMVINPAKMTWTSNIDGEFGVGDSIWINSLSYGKHIITFKYTDNNGNVCSDNISITI